ncbi:hypothetical protein A5844_000849 [Enterococcus sp. 10A9_DIV0425]|uniref:Uncharacterized protein n=1 Tax=Candidatus Enterococcus wittei TaxID=1987383 RepID=A0A2C9XT87_9ENTE|nr:hypothetical protein A5844_000849 [Enterococcus sp. 10A9_DIV0425]
MRFSQLCLYFFRLSRNKMSLFIILSIVLFDKGNLLFQYYFFGQEQGNLLNLLLGNKGILNGGFNGISLIFYFIPLLLFSAYFFEITTSPFFILHTSKKRHLINRNIFLLALVTGCLTFFYFIDLTLTHYLFNWLIYKSDLPFSVGYYPLLKLFAIRLLQNFFLELTVMTLSHLIKIPFISWFIVWGIASSMLIMPVGKWSLLFFMDQETILHNSNFSLSFSYSFFANLLLYCFLLVIGRRKCNIETG